MRRKLKHLTILLLVFFTQKGLSQSTELLKKINYLESVLNQGFSKDSELDKVSYENPEFILFSLSFTSCALTNIATQDSAFKNRAIDNISKAAKLALNKVVFTEYGFSKAPFLNKEKPGHSVLYLGHLNIILGNLRRLQPESEYNDLNNKISEYLIDSYNESKCFNLCSYPNNIWVPDNSVAMASLFLYAKNTNNDTLKIFEKWVAIMKEKYQDKKTGLLCSKIDTKNCEVKEQPRGSMIGWTIMFTQMFDSAYARALYDNYKKYHSYKLFRGRVFKEFDKGIKTGPGDIDSGPLVFGISIPATVFAYSDALIFNDQIAVRQLKRIIKIGLVKKEKGEFIKYKTRIKKMQISPLAESVLLFAETSEMAKN